MSESLFFTCGWSSLPLGGLIVFSIAAGGYGLRRRFDGVRGGDSSGWVLSGWP